MHGSMKRMLPLLVWLFAVACSDAITAAWKVPLGNFVEDLATDDRVKKLGQAPGKSAFFHEGDELWDVSAALRWDRSDAAADPFDEKVRAAGAFKWQGDWIVWNERSKLMVASGSWMDLKDAEDALGYHALPILVRVRCEILSGEAGTLERSLSLVLRSGETAKASWEGASLKLEGIANTSVWTDLRGEIRWPIKGTDQTWSVVTAATIPNGKRMLLASQGQGDGKWQLFAEVGVERIDGTPRSQTRWVENPDGVVIWSPENLDSKPVRRTLVSGLGLGIFSVPTDLVQRLDAESDDEAAFVETPPQAEEWVRGHLLDVRDLFSPNGVRIEGEGSFAGFDARGCLVIIAKKEAVDLIEQLVEGGCYEPPSHAMVETNAQSGGWCLVARSGEKAEIKRSRAGESECLFAIEPTLGSRDHLVDLRYTIDVMNGATAVGRSESASTLRIGDPQKVGSFFSDGATTDLILTVKKDQQP